MGRQKPQAKQAQLTAIHPDVVAEVRATAPSEEQLALVVAAFEALADPTRARILYALMRHPLCVRDLAIVVRLSESAISHQLRLLRDRRLVTSRRAGNVIYYSVDDHHVAALFREAEYHADHVHRALPDHPYP
jgi:ArsR family transcriptional regulator